MINIFLVRSIKVTCVSFLLLLSFCIQAKRSEYHIEIKNHLFYPARVVIPANEKVKLVIHNNDDNVEEFDSFELNREKVIFPNRSATIFIGPLPAGEYNFFGEYNPHSARGTIIVKDKPQNQIINTGEKNVN